MPPPCHSAATHFTVYYFIHLCPLASLYRKVSLRTHGRVDTTRTLKSSGVGVGLSLLASTSRAGRLAILANERPSN
jgi:hypothetical protein